LQNNYQFGNAHADPGISANTNDEKKGLELAQILFSTMSFDN